MSRDKYRLSIIRTHIVFDPLPRAAALFFVFFFARIFLELDAVRRTY